MGKIEVIDSKTVIISSILNLKKHYGISENFKFRK